MHFRKRRKPNEIKPQGKKNIEGMAHHSKHKFNVNIHQNFQLTINFGDALNTLALIGGILLIRKAIKKPTQEKK